MQIRSIGGRFVGSSCAIALAVRDIFPNAYVKNKGIICDCDMINIGDQVPDIYLPYSASNFIRNFDMARPEQRVNMKPISFEIEVPGFVINRINISEITELLKDHPTLQIV